VEVRAADAAAVQRVGDHAALVPIRGAFSRRFGWVSASSVASRLSLRRRLWTAALWPTGIALTSWDYMWRTTPMHRREETGGADDLPATLPEASIDDDAQRVEDGVGPLFHRLYRAQSRDARLSPEDVISRLGSDPPRLPLCDAGSPRGTGRWLHLPRARSCRLAEPYLG
jgi:hypothetical protein